MHGSANRENVRGRMNSEASADLMEATGQTATPTDERGGLWPFQPQLLRHVAASAWPVHGPAEPASVQLPPIQREECSVAFGFPGESNTAPSCTARMRWTSVSDGWWHCRRVGRVVPGVPCFDVGSPCHTSSMRVAVTNSPRRNTE